MNYLKKRDEFLKESKKKIDLYNKLESKSEPINESSTSYGSGPFANDIPWGDSLLGRLINSTIRKAKVAMNMARIQGPIRKLKSAMSDLVEYGMTSGFDDEQTKQFTKLKMWTFVQAIVEAIEKGYKVKQIKTTTDTTISEVEKVIEENAKKPAEQKLFKDEELKKLLKQLQDFREFLNEFDDDDGKSDPTLEGEDADEDDKEGKKEGDESDDSDSKSGEMDKGAIYPTLIKNLTALKLVLSNFSLNKKNQVESKIKLEGTKSMSSVSKPYVSKEGDTLTSISQNPANVKKLPANQIKGLNQQVMFQGKKQPLAKIKNSKGEFIQNALTPLPAGVEIKFEGFVSSFDSFVQTLEAFGDGGSPNRNTITSGESHLTQAFTKLKTDIGILMKESEKGVGVTESFINAILEKKQQDGTKQKIKDLYAQILVEFPKIPKKDPLFKESLEIISNRDKKITVAEKIARFAKRAIQFHGQNLYGGLGDLSTPLEDFVETMNVILKLKSEDLSSNTSGDFKPKKKSDEKPEEKKPEGEKKVTKPGQPIKDSSVFSYDRFILRINEAEEGQAGGEAGSESDPDREVSAPTSSALGKIKDYFYKNVDVKTYMLEKTEIEKIKTNLEAAEKSTGQITIKGMDPIFEIVKAFNRAYKLHTTQVIPTGRSGGVVSNKTFMEYTALGGGEARPDNAGESGGPYRNNAIFNLWEDAVQDVLKNTEYQKIFRGDTVLKTDDGKIIKDAGKHLAKFMNDLLDGETLYKGGSRGASEAGGAQKQFIEKYFGVTVDDAGALAEKNKGGKTDLETIEPIANQIIMTEIKFTKENIEWKELKELQATFFASLVSENTNKGDKEKIIYFVINGFDSSYLYVSYCESFSFFKQYIRTVVSPGGSIKGDLPSSMEERQQDGTEQFVMKGSRIKLDKFSKDGSSQLKGKHECTYIKKFESGKNNPGAKISTSAEPDKFKFLKFYTLAEQKTFKDKPGVVEWSRFQLKSIDDAIQKVGVGFKSLASESEVKTVEIKKNE